MPSKVNLYTEEFDTLINDRGIWCDWSRATVCNCVSGDSGQPDFTCPICKGIGFKYIYTKKIKVAVMSLLGKWELSTLQLREAGTAYITPQSHIIMGFRDRLVFNDFKCIYSEVTTFRKSTRKTDTLYRNIKNVIHVSDENYEYEEGIDFKLTDEFHLEWIGTPLKTDLKVSVLYYTTPSYLVDDLLHELRGTLSDKNTPTETFRELPKQYKIVRESFEYKISKNNDKKQEVLKEDGEGLVIGG